MGFDALFFARLDYGDKEKRMNEKSMEWVWMPSKDKMGTDVNIFTHALYQHYSSPTGMVFDVLDPGMVTIVDDPESPDFNAAYFAGVLTENLSQRAEHYATDEILALFGDDFRYMNAL